MNLRFCVPLSLITAPSTGLPLPSTMRPVITPGVAVGATVELRVQGENVVTPVRSTQKFELFVVQPAAQSREVAGFGRQPGVGNVESNRHRFKALAVLPFNSPG